MKPDKFWRTLWLLSALMLIVCAAGSMVLFFSHIGSISAAAVGVSFDPNKDPFQSELQKIPRSSVPAITGGVIYKDALPAGLSSWVWDSTLTVRSRNEVYEGSESIKVQFNKEWGGFGISGFSVDSRQNKSISFEVYPDASVGDLYIELLGGKGVPLSKQSVGWYAQGGVLVPDQWNLITIPLQNLMGSSSSITTGISLSSTHTGLVYFDLIQFSTTVISHAPWVWVAPVGYTPPPYNPFATSTPISLPYVFTNSPSADPRWYTLRGYFAENYDALTIGPLGKGRNDALTFLRGGKAWNDYQVTSKVAWGGASVFSILVRMTDENNYASCSFSAAGDTVQMYSVVGGVSTMVAQSDKLHYSDYNGGITGAGAIVQGDTLSCGVDGHEVLSEKLSDMQPQGTFGLGAWDPSDNKLGPHSVQSLRVDAIAGE